MNTTTTTTSSITLHTASYLTYCQQNKRLDPKTIKAYRIDLTQFAAATTDTSINNINPDIIKSYIATLPSLKSTARAKKNVFFTSGTRPVSPLYPTTVRHIVFLLPIDFIGS